MEYYIDGIGWISKEKGILLTKTGKIDAVIAVSRSGNLYLRTRPDIIIENNLESMG